jgi:four helix bundle protein
MKIENCKLRNANRTLKGGRVVTAEGGGTDGCRAEEIEERLLEFAARVGKVVDALPDTRLGRHVAGQLVRSGTAPAPNYAEACAAESKKDFIHKLGIALKELRETRVWLRLTALAELLPLSRLSILIDECEQRTKFISRSIITAKSNRAR